MRDLILVAMTTATAYRLFLGHRSDYLGHYLAGFGLALGLLALWLAVTRRPLRWSAVTSVMLAIAFGTATEATVFRIAIFDPVDFFSQSIGMCLAGACVVERQETSRIALELFVIAVISIVLGFIFAFA